MFRTHTTQHKFWQELSNLPSSSAIHFNAYWWLNSLFLSLFGWLVGWFVGPFKRNKKKMIYLFMDVYVWFCTYICTTYINNNCDHPLWWWSSSTKRNKKKKIFFFHLSSTSPSSKLSIVLPALNYCVYTHRMKKKILKNISFIDFSFSHHCHSFFVLFSENKLQLFFSKLFTISQFICWFHMNDMNRMFQRISCFVYFCC